MPDTLQVRNLSVGRPGPLAIICGPCVIESREHAMMIAKAAKAACDELGLPFIFKSSYTKANRTSGKSFRGLGMEEGLNILSEIREAFNVPVISDIHSDDEAEFAGPRLDITQIPAFLCRQTSLLEAAGKHSKTVMVKKGQFVAPEDMRFAVEKIRSSGSAQVLLCERGTCFGYRELVVDFRALSVMRDCGAPVIFDATHSVQVMGGAGGSSTGRRQFVAPLARAAVAWGVDGVFLECHDAPDKAPSDGPNMIPLPELRPLLADLKKLHEISLQTRSADGG